MSGQLGKRAFSALYMAILGAVAAGLLSGVKVVTSSKVADNQRFAASSNLVRVFELAEITPESTGAEMEALIKKYVREYWIVETNGSQTVTATAPPAGTPAAYHFWVQRDDAGTVAGYAFPIGGQGFWGPIKGIISVKPDGKTIRTVVWTQQGETPGLGARIEEDGYRAKFRGKLATPDIQVVDEGSMGDDPHKLDAITGASQTTKVGLGGFLPVNFAAWQREFPLVEKSLPTAAADAGSAGSAG